MWHVTVQYQLLSSQVWHTTRKDLSFLRPKVKEEKVNFQRLTQLHTTAHTTGHESVLAEWRVLVQVRRWHKVPLFPPHPLEV